MRPVLLVNTAIRLMTRRVLTALQGPSTPAQVQLPSLTALIVPPDVTVLSTPPSANVLRVLLESTTKTPPRLLLPPVSTVRWGHTTPTLDQEPPRTATSVPLARSTQTPLERPRSRLALSTVPQAKAPPLTPPRASPVRQVPTARPPAWVAFSAAAESIPRLSEPQPRLSASFALRGSRHLWRVPRHTARHARPEPTRRVKDLRVAQRAILALRAAKGPPKWRRAKLDRQAERAHQAVLSALKGRTQVQLELQRA